MFNIEKTTQIAAYLLWKSKGDIACVKLMNMMYLAEKTFLLRYGECMIGDKLVSMPHGPGLSAVYDLFLGNNEYWKYWINNPGKYQLALAPQIRVDDSEPLNTFDELSVADTKILDSVLQKIGEMSRQQIFDFIQQNCPEWEDPHGSPTQISFKDLLLKNGKSEEEVTLILQNIEEIEDLHSVAQGIV